VSFFASLLPKHFAKERHMRFLLLAFLSVLVSCGQKNPSTSVDKAERQEEYFTDVREVDLLDVAMDVPVETSGSSIVFRQSFSQAANGVRSTCNLAVTSGEAYSYRLNGNTLVIQTSSGEKMNLNRVSGEKGSIVGSWAGRARSGVQLIARRLTFVSQNRLIMRTHCES
jgi:hypothetical protein